MSPGQGKKLLTLRVRTTTNSFTDKFNEENKAQRILDEAIDRFGLNPTPPKPYELIRKTPPEKPLNVTMKLEDQGVRDGDEIFVQAFEPGDG